MLWQFIEREDEVLGLFDLANVESNYKNWRVWIRTSEGEVWGRMIVVTRERPLQGNISVEADWIGSMEVLGNDQI